MYVYRWAYKLSPLTPSELVAFAERAAALRRRLIDVCPQPAPAPPAPPQIFKYLS